MLILSAVGQMKPTIINKLVLFCGLIFGFVCMFGCGFRFYGRFKAWPQFRQ